MHYPQCIYGIHYKHSFGFPPLKTMINSLDLCLLQNHVLVEVPINKGSYFLSLLKFEMKTYFPGMTKPLVSIQEKDQFNRLDSIKFIKEFKGIADPYLSLLKHLRLIHKKGKKSLTVSKEPHISRPRGGP